jgi:DNA repair protein RecN (Recombination protein N)
MLQLVRIKNLAIVENITVEFAAGLNVITGETGAGKSIIIGALGLLLGDRADRGLIRAGEDACGVEATFALPDAKPIDALLDELGMPPCEDGHLVIRRIISANGANKIMLNDSPATLQTLQKIGNLLVDVHGPYDHQSLLSQDFQLNLLDAFAHLEKKRAAYAAIYHQIQDLEQQRIALSGNDQDVERQMDSLAFQIKEIEDAHLDQLDEAEIDREHTMAANAQQILALADGLRNGLTDDENSAFNRIVETQNILHQLTGLVDAADEWQKEAKSIAIQVQELTHTIRSFVEKIDVDPARLQYLEDQKSLLYKLKRKYGATLSVIQAVLEKSKAQMNDLSSRKERLGEVEARQTALRKELLGAGKALSKERHKAAKALADTITGELQPLGFPHGAFSIPITDCEPQGSGMDRVDFGFAPNAGEPARPLRLIASSGEISRVMLATKTVLAEHDRIPVLVFDEIDANVGGETGNAIGEKLRNVAGKHQVLCITHLPQVAVHGHTHFVVAKNTEQGRTHTHIRRIEKQERIEEVARMLGGRDLTSVTLRHAKEMLQRV